MITASIAVVAGLLLLLWGADRFIEGAASIARHWKMPALLIGMLIVGFGTSAPEMLVSATAAMEGNPAIALGNAYGSNITNIALILGLTAVISPIRVKSGVLKRELPVLAAITALAAWQLADGDVSRMDALVLLTVFAALLAWSCVQGLRERADAFASEMRDELKLHLMPFGRAWFWLIAGLVVLVISSRLLVWGAVEIAHAFGVSDLIIGLTVIAMGTSLPELASSLVAVRKGEHDLALGNVVGSNLFNTLGVVGIAGAIHPMAVEPIVLTRDAATMGALTLALFAFGYGFWGPGRITRAEGGLLLAAYATYTGFLIASVI
ncbi:MAG: calcium/sodium antiporter [Wenzhouxiangellaceae bacterium]|nr:calcium/sodium antiporter [Wenzhouxiangellaceae bacterium]